MILLDVNPREYTRQSDINKFMSLISIIKSSKFVDKIILIMVICFSKTITRGSWGTIRTGLSPRKQKIRLIRLIRRQKIR